MRRSSDGHTRDLVSTMPGAGWDFGIDRHPFHEHERPLGPHYCVYNRRLMACCLDDLPTDEGYWLLRTKAAVLHTGEWPLEFSGPDAERLLNLLFTKDITKIKPGRCGYGLACTDDGGLIVDGVLVRLKEDRFWYAQADGDFINWARAHGRGMDVRINDPNVYVSQVQGPDSMLILDAAADDGMPDPFGYFASARVSFGGQRVLITRTGYTNELGWEFYTEPHHDADALWGHLKEAGQPYGLRLFGLDSMNIRRIEAGILNAGSDFDTTTTPFDVGLGRFVDLDKHDFIGKAALEKAPQDRRLHGVRCDSATPKVGGQVVLDGRPVGLVTAGAFSPFLDHGIGLALMHRAGNGVGTALQIEGNDGSLHAATLVDLPYYDPNAEIARGKMTDRPERPK